jgi:hypothetical protein
VPVDTERWLRAKINQPQLTSLVGFRVREGRFQKLLAACLLQIGAGKRLMLRPKAAPQFEFLVRFVTAWRRHRHRPRRAYLF